MALIDSYILIFSHQEEAVFSRIRKIMSIFGFIGEINPNPNPNPKP